MRPADGRSDASSEHDDDNVAHDSDAIAGKNFDPDEDKYREKPRDAHVYVIYFADELMEDCKSTTNGLSSYMQYNL